MIILHKIDVPQTSVYLYNTSVIMLDKGVISHMLLYAYSSSTSRILSSEKLLLDNIDL